MSLISYLYLKPSAWGRHLRRTGASWWYMVHLGAVALVVAFSPSTYRGGEHGAVSRHIHTNIWQVLPWFTALSLLVSLVLIRIVIVTAISYGLSQYALEMMVRVLVLELIPLSAALFVALRAGLSFHLQSSLLLAQSGSARSRKIDLEHARHDLVPQVIANVFSVMSLAIVSSIIVLVLAYINVYGFTPWGLTSYTRTVGRIFDPIVTIGFALKTVFFGLAVAVIPVAAQLEAQQENFGELSPMPPGTMRLLWVLLLIEIASLAVKYI
ncbi:MAG: ABC transporter permease [Herbaspirillum sp.]